MQPRGKPRLSASPILLPNEYTRPVYKQWRPAEKKIKHSIRSPPGSAQLCGKTYEWSRESRENIPFKESSHGSKRYFSGQLTSPLRWVVYLQITAFHFHTLLRDGLVNLVQHGHRVLLILPSDWKTLISSSSDVTVVYKPALVFYETDQAVYTHSNATSSLYSGGKCFKTISKAPLLWARPRNQQDTCTWLWGEAVCGLGIKTARQHFSRTKVLHLRQHKVHVWNYLQTWQKRL